MLRRTERQSCLQLPTFTFDFNPRSDERSDMLRESTGRAYRYFNPRSDERSDLTRIVVFPEEKNISIHAPTNGATVSGCLILMKTMKFQSTLRRTERPDQGRKGRQGQSISIHAPTNGATLALSFPLHAPLFQSTLRRTERRYSWHSVG